ncbi:TrgA family protein [Yoonia sp. 2307UL14-13]|uniref:TrgA family protein n=1 Tax=Yoonia sp. 2307UL14-13 TaxID=3126506 RepID=UPI00309B1016
MPTAGRLAAAVVFFIYGWSIALQATPLFPEANPPNYVLPLSIIIAVLIGWRVVGAKSGRGLSPAVGIGLTAAFLYILWMSFLISFWNMIRKSMRNLYGGPMEAVVDVFNLMLEFAVDMFDVTLIISIVAGAVICSLIAEYFGRRYP